MANWQQIRPALTQALAVQAYRPVDMSTLPDETVRWPVAGDPTIDSALGEITRATNWNEVGRQIKLFATSRGFVGLYIRRDSADLEIVVAQGWSGGPLRREFIEAELQHAWNVHRPISSFVDRFELSDATKQRLSSIVDHYTGGVSVAGAGPPRPENSGGWDVDIDEILRTAAESGSGAPEAALSRELALALALLQLALDVANTDSATGTLVVVGTDGLTDELRNRLEKFGGFGHQDALVMSRLKPSMFVVGVDAVTLRAHGHTPWGSVDVGKLGAELRYAFGTR